MTAKNLFTTSTFKGATIALLAGLATVMIDCAYGNHRLTKTEALTVISLLTTYSWALVGRSSNDPVYTSHGLPGANKEDFEKE